MKATWFVPVVLYLTVAFSCTTDEESVEKKDECLTVAGSGHGTAVQDRFIVSFPATGEGYSAGGRKTISEALLLKKHGIDEEKILNQFEGEHRSYVLAMTASEAAALEAEPGVIAVEQDKRVSLCACFTVIEPKLVTWNVNKVGFGDGSGKTAWILDTGVELRHSDLHVDTVRSRSFISDAPTAADDNGHGTHVAGIIAAKNNRIGTLGVASGARVIALKVLDSEGNGLLSDVLDALAFVRKNAKAGEVVNISLGVDEFSDILDNEVKALAATGIYIVVAAGNEGQPAKNFSPGRANGTNIYTVSAVDSLDRFAKFSNFGNEAVDFAAPGVRILSTYIFGKYAIMSGTSMAAPHVAGLLLINEGKVNRQGSALNDPDGAADPLAHK